MDFLNVIRKYKKNLELYGGIRSRKYAFRGPRFAEINVTNHCSNSCIVCWFYSPLMGDISMSREEKKAELPWPKLKSLLADLMDMGCEKIQFSGGGEPFMHPHLMDAVAYACQRGALCSIVTSGYLLNKKVIDRFIELEVNRLSVSLWAGSPEIYRETHPGKNSKQYEHIVDMCRFMIAERNRRGLKQPLLQLQHCMFKTNVNDIDNMFEIALNIGADQINFMTFIAVPEKTDHLSLSAEERAFAADRIEFWSEEIKRRGKSLDIMNAENLKRRLDESPRDEHYDSDIVNKIGCYMG